MLRIGEWCVNPASGEISREGETGQLEARPLRLLLHLARHAGEVVSVDDLLKNVWSGVTVSPDSVYQAVAALRRQLRDDPKQPCYIATVPRLGYRVVASVSPIGEIAAASTPPSSGDRSRFIAAARWAGGFACLFIAVVVLFYARGAKTGFAGGRPQADRSIAVLPFLDLTDKMSHEIFADGMTEEVIDRLTKISGFHVVAPRTSFQLKGKKMTIGDVAKTLGVRYVLDGSIRNSGSTMRVAARLVRADNGYVVWTESFERSWNDPLAAQKEIAEEVMKAVRASFPG
jgi:TolB-like protein/DNA-binding winged helix-turn-helix (wHTH) protein